MRSLLIFCLACEVLVVCVVGQRSNASHCLIRVVGVDRDRWWVWNERVTHRAGCNDIGVRLCGMSKG